MPTILTENSQQVTDSYQEVYDWLHTQTEVLGLEATLFTDEATLRHGWLYLPVYIAGVADAYDNAIKLQKLEDTWNDRSSQPEPPLFLVPAKSPLHQAAMERVSMALQRKMKAVNAFGSAVNQQEQEKAAAEFRDAEQAENEANLAYERIMPWNEHVP